MLTSSSFVSSLDVCLLPKMTYINAWENRATKIYLYSSNMVGYHLLWINQINYIKISFGIGKHILLFNIQRLEITTFAGRCSANLVRAPLNNVPSAPSKFLLSQSTDHFKGMEWIVWEKRAREEMLRQELKKGCKCLGKEGKGFGQSFTVLMLYCGMRPQDIILYD